MLRSAIIEVVKYQGSPDVFAWRFPDTALGTWTQLIVNASQEAILFKGGHVYDMFGPGRHTLSTANIPILNGLLNLPFHGRSPFTAEVWFINKQHTLDIKWGTPTPIQLKDPKHGIVIPVRAFGQFGITVEETKPFMTKLVGTLPTFDSQDVINFFRGMYLTKVRATISKYITEKEISVLEINAHLLDLSDDLKESIDAKLRDEYGIRVLNFFVNDMNIPENDASVVQLKSALAKHAEMALKGFDRGGVTGQGMADLSQHIQTKRTKKCQACHHVMEEAVRFCGSCGHDTQGIRTKKEEATIVCTCGHRYRETYKFCPECGVKTPHVKACISCHEAIDDHAKFCHHCGISQLATTAQASKYCANCLAEVSLDAKFCMSCGVANFKI
ncbi:MAG: SPFH domain-containing protein [Defluviitaleaceae bacterium]|nr:SPFH domain-containing protein [Defluviitaleaceae bacterium]